MKDSFIMYMSYRDAIAMLTTEEKGILLEAIINHHAGENLPELPPSVRMIFSIIKPQFDRDAVKYENIVDRNRKNIRSRWRNHTSGKSGKITNGDNDDDSDDENENENENDSDDVNAAGPASYDRELNNIINLFFDFFKKGKLKSKSINRPQVKAAWQRAIKTHSAIEIHRMFRKAWTSSYLKENGELPWLLDHLDEIKSGKYDDHNKKNDGIPIYQAIKDNGTTEDSDPNDLEF